MIPKLVTAAGLMLVLAGCVPGAADVDWNPHVFVVDVATGERTQLTDGAASYSTPSWSPDGRRLAVVALRGESAAIEIVGLDGAKRTVVRGDIAGVAWSPDGSSLAYVTYREPNEWSLHTIAVDGSNERRLATHRSSRFAATGPSWSPDGESIAASLGGDAFVVPGRGGAAKLVAAKAWAPAWSPDGRYLLLTRRTGPMTQPEVELAAAPVGGGEALVLADDLLDAHASWSPDSQRVAFAGVRFESDRRYHLNLATPGAGQLRTFDDVIASVAPTWSPRGNTLGVATWEGEVELVDPEDGESSRLLRLRKAEIRDLAWSPDGSRIAFVAGRRHEGD